MKIAMIIVRTLMGLLYLFASVAYFFNLVTPPEMTGPIKTFNEGLAASGYFFTLLKITELIGALALISGRFVPLALIILAPITINIFMVHLFMERSGLPVAIFLMLAHLFVAYNYRESFAEVLKP